MYACQHYLANFAWTLMQRQKCISGILAILWIKHENLLVFSILGWRPLQKRATFLTFLSLPHKDIIIDGIFPYLNIKDFENLIFVNKTLYHLVFDYLQDKNCTQINFTGVDIYQNPLRNIIEKKTNITHITFDDFMSTPSGCKDETIIPYLENNQNLLSVSLKNCDNLTDETFIRIAALHKLEYITIINCKFISEDIL